MLVLSEPHFSVATVLLPLMSCLGPRHFPSLTGVKIPCVIARVCFQMQFLPTAAASLGAVAAGCLGLGHLSMYWEWLPTSIYRCHYIRKGKVGFLVWGFFSFVFICQAAIVTGGLI